ncbi:conserved membrane hypothetical protein [Candidatus Sulfopaludibacter sp. SbA3]|nr:conserved membrane hypothetical protein [Candidatus Sulfopaludibacter sp. SbA3]
MAEFEGLQVPFDELQELWQSQSSRLPLGIDASGLSSELRRFGRQQTWINLIKVAVLIRLFWRILTASHWAPLAVSGLLLMYVGLVTYLVLDWRNQIGLSRLNFSAPSVEFIRDARLRLQHQLNPMRRVFWLLVVTVGGGFNLMMLADHGSSLLGRISEHLIATTLPFGAYVLGQRIRQFRFKRECGAVMERLDTLLRELEEKSS